MSDGFLLNLKAAPFLKEGTHMRWIACAALVSWIFCFSDSHAADGPRVELIGTVQTPHGGVAVCRNATGQTFSLKSGSSFEGWTLTDVGRDDVTFVKASVSAKVQILSPITPGSMPPPQAPPPSPTAAASPTADGNSQSTAGPHSTVPKGKWVDGDGQIIDPPK